MGKKLLKLMLDSGAFPAWNRGIKIDLKGYVRFIEKNADLLDCYISLDAIPKSRDHRQAELAASSSYSNFRFMKSCGLKPIPVFHYGERWYWLQKLIDECDGFIALGGAARLHGVARSAWLDDCFQFLCGAGSYPPVKVHGLAITAPEAMHRYPFYSVDSVTWMLPPSYGQVYIPQQGLDGKSDYSRSPYIISVSSSVGRANAHRGASKSSMLHGAHIDTCGEVTRRYICNYLEREGYDLESLRHDYCARMRVVTRFFMRSAASVIRKPFRAAVPSIFGRTIGTHAPGKNAHDFHLFFSMCDSRETLDVLTVEGANDRLLGYHYFVEKPKSLNLRHIVMTGVFPPKPKKPKKVK
jgi:hypothetical protein